jgi:hypothetical protein
MIDSADDSLGYDYRLRTSIKGLPTAPIPRFFSPLLL